MDVRSGSKPSLSQFCSVRDAIKGTETLVFATLSLGSMVVGGIHLKECLGSPFLPWWLLVHGTACALYYLGALISLLSIPLEVNRLIGQVSTLERIIGSVLDSLGMPPGRHFVRDESPVSSFQEVICNNKDRFRQKLQYHELAFACFGVFFLCSVCFGAFVSALTPLGHNCNRSTHVYSIVLVVTSLIQVAVKSYRTLQDGAE